MEDLVREMKTMNKNLLNLQTQAEKDKEDINRRMNNLEDQLDNIRSNYQRDIESSQKCSSDVESGERIQLRIMQQEQTGSTLLW